MLIPCWCLNMPSRLSSQVGWVPQDQSQRWRCAQSTHRSWCIIILTTVGYFWERIPSQTPTVRCPGTPFSGVPNPSVGGPGTFQEASPVESDWVHWIPQQQVVTKCMKWCLPGSSLETQYPGFLLVASHGVVGLAHTKIPGSWKEKRCLA